jgi:ribosomal protein S10
MNLFKIIITSKNQVTIHNFFLFIYQNKINKLNILKNIFQKKKKKEKLTILKSPHVNKIAQEQFEQEFLKKQFKIQTIKNSNYLVYLKKLNFNIYPDTNIILKCNNNMIFKSFNFKVFNPNNFKFDKHFFLKIQNTKLKTLIKIKNKSKLFKNLNSYLYIMDIYGESQKHV